MGILQCWRIDREIFKDYQKEVLFFIEIYVYIYRQRSYPFCQKILNKQHLHMILLPNQQEYISQFSIFPFTTLADMNNYQIISTIGEGAYGVVLKAKRLDNNALVAIKKFKQTDDDDLIRKTTVRELKVLRALQHKNIVELKEAFKKKGIVYLIFEYLDNNLLEVLERSQNGLPVKTIMKFIYQLLEGLSFMHQNNYVHRDVKPQNLLINKNQGILKICDMGFARLLDQHMTDYVATRWYRPPQLLIGMKYSTSIDIWAVGCIMTELTDSQPLFPGADEIDQLYRIISGIGNLPEELQQKMNKNAVWKDLRFPTTRGQSFRILEKYRQKLGEKGVNLLQMMLELDPEKRITALQAMKHPFFDPIRPKKQRFQKTSDGWLLKPKEKVILNQNYTDRRTRQPQLLTQPKTQTIISTTTSKNTLKCPLKSNTNKLLFDQNAPSKHPYYHIKQAQNRNTYFEPNFTNSISIAENNSLLMDINLNKIYRKIQYNSQNKFMVGMPPRIPERLVTDTKPQKLNFTIKQSNSQQNLSSKNHSKTRTEFRLNNKRKQKPLSNNFYGHA